MVYMHVNNNFKKICFVNLVVWLRFYHAYLRFGYTYVIDFSFSCTPSEQTNKHLYKTLLKHNQSFSHNDNFLTTFSLIVPVSNLITSTFSLILPIRILPNQMCRSSSFSLALQFKGRYVCSEDKGLDCYWLFLLVSLIGSALSSRDYDTPGIILHIIFLSPGQNGCRIVESVLFSVPSEGRVTIFKGNHKSSASSKRNEVVGWSFCLIFFFTAKFGLMA